MLLVTLDRRGLSGRAIATSRSRPPTDHAPLRFDYRFFRAIIVLVGMMTVRPFVCAQAVATGIIEGRVLNATSGAYLNNARVIVPGTRLETFTSESGEYRLTEVAEVSSTCPPPAAWCGARGNSPLDELAQLR